MEYAAGTLVPAVAALVGCHLALCERCRAEVAFMERIGGALLGRLSHAELGEKAVSRVAALAPRQHVPPAAGNTRARQTDAVLPAPLARHLGVGIGEIPWKTLAPGVEQFKIKVPRQGGDLRLLRVQPGLKLLRHGHYGMELTLVLKGAYADETGEYHAGEVADLDEDIEHRPRVKGDGECICLIAGETYPRYNSLAIRLFRPFLGL
jgi:putative transcriptional regulator